MKKFIPILATAFTMIVLVSCERTIDDLEPSGFPTDGEVFIDGFVPGMFYTAYGSSKVTAFEVDNVVTFSGTASMRFEVPSTSDPNGVYSGGVFGNRDGRDLSGYDVLTFWAKASEPISLDEIGFGEIETISDELFGTRDSLSKYRVAVNGLELNTNWKKYYIPIPDPSKLNPQYSMLHYAEVAENEVGYTLWIDEVRYEKLGTLANPRPGILEGQDQVVLNAVGDSISIEGVYLDINLPAGVDQRMTVAPAFLKYSSSNPSVATVNSEGKVMVLDSGQTVVTASLLGVDAAGSLTINSTGQAAIPSQPAPTPTVSADSVISMFSDAYTNVKIDTWNTRWQFSTAEDDDLQINGNNVKRYTNLNFVGIEFASAQIDAGDMTHFHIDMWTPNPTDLPASFKVLLIDFGPNGVFDGGDDTQHELSFTRPLLQTEEWVSIDVPLSAFTGLTNRNNLAQMVLSGDLPTVFVDNVYFYNKGQVVNIGPDEAAPDPTRNENDVISIYSDAYMNLAGTNIYPDWGQATSFSEKNISGNNFILYSGLDYQGIELGGSTDVSAMTHLHLDYWTDNSTALNTFLISNGPVEAPVALTVPTAGWSGIDIPLSSFSPVDLADLLQFKFDGNGDIYLDNIYFFKDTGGGNMPTGPAPDPTDDPADVISVFSDNYNDIMGTNLNPDWGQGTMMSEMLIDGNNTIVYNSLDYQGIELGSNIDVTAMSTLYLDVWTANSTALDVFLISPGPVEKSKAITVPTSGWQRVEIDLTEFTPVDLTNVFQFKFVGNGDIYIDNIYFRK